MYYPTLPVPYQPVRLEPIDPDNPSGRNFASALPDPAYDAFHREVREYMERLEDEIEDMMSAEMSSTTSPSDQARLDSLIHEHELITMKPARGVLYFSRSHFPLYSRNYLSHYFSIAISDMVIGNEDDRESDLFSAIRRGYPLSAIEDGFRPRLMEEMESDIPNITLLDLENHYFVAGGLVPIFERYYPMASFKFRPESLPDFGDAR